MLPGAGRENLEGYKFILLLSVYKTGLKFTDCLLVRDWEKKWRKSNFKLNFPAGKSTSIQPIYKIQKVA